ncbi:MAG: hypothetical protein Q9172_002899 [Xanthocarpia lactea]
MSPRRSSRSKTSQPTSVAQHTSSSSSSVSSARVDIKSGSDGKPSSPRASLLSKSPSSENQEHSTKSQARRTRSSQEAPKTEPDAARDDEELDEDDAEEEEEVTRCVCGHQEYPGMPITSSDPARGSSKNTGDPGDAGSSVTLQEDTGGLFIQCDVCKVWQHGGCVGVMDEAMSPEEYFCEQCRKELHTITTTTTGQRYSNYLPVQDISSPQPSPSPTLPNDSPQKPKESRSSRLNAERHAGNRRSTMNSRDAAYYEAEQLRQAIEESKKASTTGASSTSRKVKRSRDEDDQGKDDNKRQRTKSGSSASSNDKEAPQDHEEVNEETHATLSPSAKNIRGAAARNHRNKELRDQEEKREKDRADAAGRRKGRAEKRRGDGKANTFSDVYLIHQLIFSLDSDPSEEPLSRNTSSKGADQIHAAATPPTSQATQSSQKGSHHKRTGRPPARRGRVGRNQWTRDRESRPDTPKNTHPATSPSPHSHNSKEGHISPKRANGNQNRHPNGSNGDVGKATHNKPRYTNPQRTSMIEMKRRVAAMLEFINQADRELAAEMTLMSASVSSSRKMVPISSARTTAAVVVSSIEEQKKYKHQRLEQQTKEQQQQQYQNDAASFVMTDLDPERFRALEVVEMKEMMKKVILDWQKEFG